VIGFAKRGLPNTPNSIDLKLNSLLSLLKCKKNHHFMTTVKSSILILSSEYFLITHNKHKTSFLMPSLLLFAGQPTIVFISSDTVSFEGREIYLVCNVTNDPDAVHPLKVNWYNSEGIKVESDGKHVIAYNIIDKVANMTQSVLKFSTLRRSDDGTYTCRAYNDPESHTERKTILSIECT